MVTTKLVNGSLLDQRAESFLFLCEQDVALSSPKGSLKDVMRETPHLKDAMKKRGFTGKLQQSFVLPVESDDKMVYYIFVGLGKKNKIIPVESYRRALGLGLKKAIKLKCSSTALSLPPAALFGSSIHEIAKQTVIIAHMTSYHFNEFITEDNLKETVNLDLNLCFDAKNKKTVMQGIKIGECMAKAVNKARYWIDLPPSMLTPPHLADKAQDIAKKHNLSITILNEKQINKIGMGGLSAVSQGSDLDCRLCILEYKTKRKKAPTLAFVGKGITFDSGGLSLKPPQYMERMKEDMSGAAAVIATMEALAQLKPDVNVIGVTPLSENLPSGKAAKPGDIVTFYNGKTAEVRNTDAEGRLILADALSYTVKHYRPDAIVDIATLTGSCQNALGPFYSGLMSKHDDLIKCIDQASLVSGDRVWQLPFDDDYKAAIKSNVADICNIGNAKYMAGAITAGFFLSHFVEDVPWAHLDIAGTAFNVPDMPYYRCGATGVGVRLLVELAMHWK